MESQEQKEESTEALDAALRHQLSRAYLAMVRRQTLSGRVARAREVERLSNRINDIYGEGTAAKWIAEIRATAAR
jgi:hypothetical protein